MEKKALKSAIKEFNSIVVLGDEKGNPMPLNHKSETAEKDLYDALEAIEDGDTFTAETEAVFAELRAKYDKPKKDKSEKKSKSKAKPENEVKAVKAGTTVEMDADTDKIKIEKTMKKEKEAGKPAKGEAPEVRIIKTILDRKVGKDTLVKLIENEDVFDKKTKKALSKVTNFMALKKEMLDVFDQELVKKYRAELPPIDKTPKAKAVAGEKKSEKVKDNPIVNSIKSAIKVKQLKGVAKENDIFNWKKLKKLDFEEMQTAMLKVVEKAGGSKVKSEPAKPKMIANPLIATVNEYKKLKKLVAYAKENKESFPGVKAKKFDDVDELKEALIASIPAEIEVKGKSSGATGVKRESNWDERKPYVESLIDAAKYTRPELMEKLEKKFPGQTKSHSNMCSEIKNVDYAHKYGLKALVTTDDAGAYVWVEAKKEKKDKKNKKNKK